MAVTTQFVTIDAKSLDGFVARVGAPAARARFLAAAADVMRTQLLAAIDSARKAAPELTGKFKASLEPHVEVTGSTLTGGIGTFGGAEENQPYFGVVEYGSKGPIRAKKAFSGLVGGPYMAIPLDAATDSEGIPRFTVRDADAAFSGGTFLAKTKTKGWLVFGRLTKAQKRPRGSGSRKAVKAAGLDPNIVPIFALRSEIPARKGTYVLRNAFDMVVPKITAALHDLYIQELLNFKKG
jgi:hypothetical protein